MPDAGTYSSVTGPTRLWLTARTSSARVCAGGLRPPAGVAFSRLPILGFWMDVLL